MSAAMCTGGAVESTSNKKKRRHNGAQGGVEKQRRIQPGENPTCQQGWEGERGVIMAHTHAPPASSTPSHPFHRPTLSYTHKHSITPFTTDSISRMKRQKQSTKQQAEQGSIAEETRKIGTNNNTQHLDFWMGTHALDKRVERAIPDKIATHARRVEADEQKKKKERKSALGNAHEQRTTNPIRQFHNTNHNTTPSKDQSFASLFSSNWADGLGS